MLTDNRAAAQPEYVLSMTAVLMTLDEISEFCRELSQVPGCTVQHSMFHEQPRTIRVVSADLEQLEQMRRDAVAVGRHYFTDVLLKLRTTP